VLRLRVGVGDEDGALTGVEMAAPNFFADDVSDDRLMPAFRFALHKHVLADIDRILTDRNLGPLEGWFLPVTYEDAKGEVSRLTFHPNSRSSQASQLP
jgi:hypothetical protein